MHRLPERLHVEEARAVDCPPGWSWTSRPETFGHFNLWCVVSGRGAITVDGDDTGVGLPADVELTPGRVLLLRPRTACRATHDPRHPLAVCYAHLHFLDAAGGVVRPADADLPPRVGRLDPVRFYEQVLRRVADLTGGRTVAPPGLGDAGDAGHAEAACYVRGVVAGLSGGGDVPLVGLAREQHERMHAVARRLRDDPASAGDVASLASDAGYTPDHFARVFRRVIGTGPKAYALSARIDRAAHLLRHSAMSVGQVAAATGYADVFFFSRQFKAKTGVTPSEYRGA